jgi:DNA-binding CsgD family transcriptional regulator
VLTTYDEDADILRACAKLGVSGRTAAVAAATERGLLWHPAS